MGRGGMEEDEEEVVDEVEEVEDKRSNHITSQSGSGTKASPHKHHAEEHDIGKVKPYE